MQAGGDRCSNGFFVIDLTDGTLFPHTQQDEVAAGEGAGRAIDRVAGLGCLGHTGQHGCLGQGKFAEVPAVVSIGGGLDTIRVLAERDNIEIQREDFFLRQLSLDLQGKQHLLEFPQKSDLGLARDVLYELHGYG